MAATPGLLVLVRFKSRLTAEELRLRYQARMPEFRQLAGLQQKYHVRDEAADEWGGLYFWESKASLEEYLASELRSSIAEAFEVEEAPRVEVLQVVDVLRT